MVVYLGTQRFKVHLGATKVILNISSDSIFIKNVLVSYDNKLLKDSNNIYLKPKESV